MKIERERHEVVLTGVPGNSVEIDIINFLCNVDIDVENIKIVDGSAYNGTKEVYIHSLGNEEVDKALEMDGCLFGSKFGRYRVRVYRKRGGAEAKHSKLNAAKKDRGVVSQKINQSRNSAIPSSSGECRTTGMHSNIVVLDGMPPAMSKEDVQYLLWGTNVTQRNISIVRREKEPYILVFFQNEENAASVVKRWNGTVITTKNGSHTVRVRVASELLDGIQQVNDDLENNVLKMTEIPPKITPQDIAEFLKGFAVKDRGIHLQSDPSSYHESVAYIEFEGYEAAQRALEKDFCHLGGRFRDKRCRLAMIPRIQMELELLRNNHRGDISARCGSRSADKFLNLHQQMLNSYQMMHGRTMLNPRMLVPHTALKLPMTPKVSFKLLDSVNSNHLSPSKGIESLKNAKYYVKDLETGRFLYLDQCFAPASVPSSETLEGEDVEHAREPEPGSSGLNGDANNISSESDATLVNFTRSGGAQNADRAQHKRQSAEMVAGHGMSTSNERPHKHR